MHSIDLQMTKQKHYPDLSADKTALISRIVLISDSDQASVEVRRHQFPIRLAFAMIINKFQGQTLDKVGVCPLSPVLCHGQLYIAMPRVKRSENIKILLNAERSKIKDYEGMYTANVVYKKVL